MPPRAAIPLRGVAPLASFQAKTNAPTESGPESGPPHARNAPGEHGGGRAEDLTDAEVKARIVTGLPRLTPAKLRAVLAIVEGNAKG